MGFQIARPAKSKCWAKQFQLVDLGIYRDESKIFPVLDLKPFEFRVYQRTVGK